MEERQRYPTDARCSRHQDSGSDLLRQPLAVLLDARLRTVAEKVVRERGACFLSDSGVRPGFTPESQSNNLN